MFFVLIKEWKGRHSGERESSLLRNNRLVYTISCHSSNSWDWIYFLYEVPLPLPTAPPSGKNQTSSCPVALCGCGAGLPEPQEIRHQTVPHMFPFRATIRLCSYDGFRIQVLKPDSHVLPVDLTKLIFHGFIIKRKFVRNSSLWFISRSARVTASTVDFVNIVLYSGVLNRRFDLSSENVFGVLLKISSPYLLTNRRRCHLVQPECRNMELFEQMPCW